MKKKQKKKLKSELRDIMKKYGNNLDWMEDGELRSWVGAGNSPLENPEDVKHGDGTPLDFIEWYRNAEWVTEKINYQPFTSFEGLRHYLETDFQPNSRKEAVKCLHRLQELFSEELDSFIRFLRSENLMDSYEVFKLLEDNSFQEELPFM